MQLGAIGRTAPVLLILGGIAAPLAFAELFVWHDGPAPLANVRSFETAPATGFLPAELAGDCAAAKAGIVAIGPAVTLDDNPYAVAEGKAPHPGQPSIGLLHQAPVVLGARLRVEAPVAAVDAGCATDPAYGSPQPAGAVET